METPKKEPNNDELSSSKTRTTGKNIFAVLRLVIFGGIIVWGSIALLHIDKFILSLNPLWLTGGGLVALMVIAGLVFLVVAPGSTLTSAAFDLESIAVVALGLIALIFLLITSLFTRSTSPEITFGLILMSIYTIYVYRMLHQVVRGRQENDAIRKKYGELVQFDREKSDFITVTSHQLRTPLTEVRWALGAALKDATIPESPRSILQKCLQSVERLAGIVDDMFRARAFDLSDSNLKKEAVDAEEIIKQIMSGLELLTHQKETDLTFSPPEHAVLLDADRARIKIALENVIDNAVRYSPKGAVRITLREEGEKALIRVEDSGMGIPQNEQNMIFTKFFRAKNALLLQPDGSGIGLYATKTIITRHGGTISFISEPGKGTIFLISLPVVKK